MCLECKLPDDEFALLMQGRGGSTGYDIANGLYAHADIEELEKENLKKFTPGDGTAVFSVAKVTSAPKPPADCEC